MKTFLDRIAAGDKTFFDVSTFEQLSYLDTLKPVKDDWDRSFNQYKAQTFFQTKFKISILNFISFWCLFLFVPFYIILGLFIKREKSVEAISRLKESEHCEPNSLLKRYNIDRTLWHVKGAICPIDIPFVINLWVRYFINPYFVIKSIYKIAKYSSLICRYSPHAIIVCDEFSFTSSILTLLCEGHGIKHIDVMHGEKMLYIRDSFFRFHECFVWNEHYIKLFKMMQAEPTQFKIELPLSMKFEKADYKSFEYYADYKYYLANYTEAEITSIVASMDFAKALGKTVKFRPHPHYSDIPLLKKHVEERNIELPSVDILVSLSNCQHVVGLYSTVLVQAYLNGCDVILDDVTYKKKYEKLADVKYILSNKVNHKLSELQ